VRGIEETVFRGREGYRQWFEATWETYDDVSFEPHSFRSLGDRVLVVYATRVRAKRSGVELEKPGAAVLTFRDGLLVRQIGYQHPKEALEAVGLREEHRSIPI
jgi:ketosteroid isomerase-like protein